MGVFLITRQFLSTKVLQYMMYKVLQVAKEYITKLILFLNKSTYFNIYKQRFGSNVGILFTYVTPQPFMQLTCI